MEQNALDTAVKKSKLGKAPVGTKSCAPGDLQQQLLLLDHSFVKISGKKLATKCLLSAKCPNTNDLQTGLFNYTGLSVRALRNVHQGISVLFLTECQHPL